MPQKLKILLISLLTVAVAAVFYFAIFGAQQPANEIPVVTVEPEPEIVYSHPLSGILMDEEADFFAISIIYDNFEVDRQPGLDQAHIIYEALTEGGITRFLAVFADA